MALGLLSCRGNTSVTVTMNVINSMVNEDGIVWYTPEIFDDTGLDELKWPDPFPTTTINSPKTTFTWGPISMTARTYMISVGLAFNDDSLMLLGQAEASYTITVTKT